jgi:hypothetical protein
MMIELVDVGLERCEVQEEQGEKAERFAQGYKYKIYLVSTCKPGSRGTVTIHIITPRADSALL